MAIYVRGTYIAILIVYHTTGMTHIKIYVYFRLGSNGPHSTFHVIKIIVCKMQKTQYVKKSVTCHVLAVKIV